MTDDRKHDTRECCDELARVWHALGDPAYTGASASERVAEMRDALTAALDRAKKAEVRLARLGNVDWLANALRTNDNSAVGYGALAERIQLAAAQP